MALFWSKKPKAEKNYSETTRKAMAAGKKNNQPHVKGVKTGGEVAPAKLTKTGKPIAGADKSSQIIPAVSPSSHSANVAGVILRPRVTEKAGILAQSNVYTFEVVKSATKGTVAKAIDALYKVKPTKIAIMNHPARAVFVKGRHGTVPGMKKALVTLKKGDKIDFV